MLRIAALTIVLLTLWPALADEAGPRVTTDNVEYCEALAARLAASPQPVAEASRDLGEEGRRLCANGHVRTGIAKLRRALRATRAELRAE
ncbi:MAG: hypothetical protein K5Q68_01730 [Roseococcus sp.]|nr:hypothetical protein [Roseococcus sp.]